MFGNSAIFGQDSGDIYSPIIGTLTYNNITQNSVDLTCAATDNIGVGSFKIFLNGVFSESVNISNMVNYTIAGLTPNTPYNIYVTAVDYTGNESDHSNTINFTTTSDIVNSYITITTNSTSTTWSPNEIVNSGETLYWKVEGGVTISELQENIPTFDLSSNTGICTITIRSTSYFSGFTALKIDSLNILTTNVIAAIDLELFSCKLNPGYSSTNITTLTELSLLTLRSNNLFSIDLSNNTLLTEMWIYNNQLTGLEITNNPLLIRISAYNNSIPTVDLENIIIQLDNNNLINGFLYITGNDGITSNVYTEYKNLIAKGWYIDVAEPENPSNPATGIKPIMANFRVENDTPNQVKFDTILGSVYGIEATDFFIEGKNINSVTIINDNTGYFTLSEDLDFWDNILIRKEGDNEDIVYNFTLQYIFNNIDEPTSIDNKYVEVGASGIGTVGDPMSISDAVEEASQGTTYWIKAGDYQRNSGYVINNGGTKEQPVKFIGYKNSINDNPSLNRQDLFDGVTTFSSSEMPLFGGGSGAAAIDCGNNNNIILRNIQYSDWTKGGSLGFGIYINNSTHIILDNCYGTETEGYSVMAFDGDCGYSRVINSYFSNSQHGGVKLQNEYNLIENTWAVSTYDVGMDYYLTIYGGYSGQSNIVRDCYLNRYVDDSHSGHGISFKADQHGKGYFIENSLIENCNLVNTKIEIRHRPTQYNVIRNIDINGSGISFHDGGSYNTFENVKSYNASYFILWLETIEDPQDEPYVPHENAHHNTFINCIADNNDYLLRTSIYPYDFSFLDDIDDNKWINCTFKDIQYVWTNYSLTNNAEFNPTNIFENCIFDRVGYDGVGEGATRMNPTITNSDLYNSYWAASGSNFDVNPQLDSNYQPQALLSLMAKDRAVDVYYDKNDNERNDPSTVGAVIHADEVIEAPVIINTPVLSNFRIEDGEPDRVYFDTPLGYPTELTTTGFVITGKTISAVTQDGNGGYFTASNDFNWSNNNTIRLGEIDDLSNRQTGIYNFTLRHISNNIPIPATTSEKYVTTTGGGDGSSLGTPMTLQQAFTEATPGTRYNVQKGDYGSTQYTIGGSGGLANPVVFEGYNEDPWDSPAHTFTNNVILDSDLMPYMNQVSQSSGTGIDGIGRDYIVLKNFQVDGYQYGIAFDNSDGIILDNCYVHRSYSNFFFNTSQGISNSRLLNCHAQDSAHEGFYNTGSHNLISGCYAATSADNFNMDYYFLTVGRGSESGYHIIKDCIANRFTEESHSGHGFDLKRQHTGAVLQYNLVEDCTAYNQGQTMSFRHTDSTRNIGRNIKAFGDRSEGNLVTFRDGADHNQIENSYGEDIDVMIKLRSNQTENPGIQPCSTDNRVINCIVDGCDLIIDERRIDGSSAVPASTGNKFINNTFLNANNVYESSYTGLNSMNEFINNIFQDDAGTITGTFTPTMTNNIIVNTPSLVSYVGSNGNIDTDPFLDVDYVPQADFSTIDAARINGVYYDINDDERQDPTTIGSKLSAEEVPNQPPVEEYDFYVSATGTGDGLTSDTPMSFADSQTTINSMTAGQSIAYKGGDEFLGQLNIPSRNNITITSYGTGQAVITGSDDILGWASEGGSVWSVSSQPNKISQVFKGGVSQSNSQSINYDINSVQNNKNAFRSDALIGHADLVGASVMINVWDWRYEMREISAFDSGTGQITLGSDTQQNISNRTFWLSNHVNLLATENDWSYDSVTDKLYYYAASTPTGISASTNAGDLITVTTSTDVVIDNIELKHSNSNGVYSDTSTRTVVKNSTLNENYQYSVFTEGGNATTINNNIVGNTVMKSLRSWTTNSVITNNTVSNTGVKSKITNKWVPDDTGFQGGIGIESRYSGTLIQYNSVINSGYAGIDFRDGTQTIENNFVQDYGQLAHDVGGIYTYTENSTGSSVRYNIVENQDDSDGWYRVGIYMDNRADNMTIQYNTAIGGLNGVYLHEATNCDVLNNNISNSTKYSIYMQEDDAGAGYMVGNVIDGNNVLTANASYPALGALSWYDSSNMGSSNNNNFFNMVVGSYAFLDNNISSRTYDIGDWRTESGNDINSTTNDYYWLESDPVDTWTRHDYNATKEVSTIVLTGDWEDLEGNVFSGSYDLQPYTSQQLILTSAKTAVGTWTEVFAQNNAASIDTEVNATTNWTMQGSGTMTSDATENQTGLYSIKGVTNNTDWGVGVRYDMTTTVGKQFKISLWAKRNGTQTGAFQEWGGWSNIPDEVAWTSKVKTNTWVKYSWIVIASSTTPSFIGYPNESQPSAGDDIYIDSVSVKEYQ